MTMEDFMNKRFGASGINREMFTDCFVGTIRMERVSDSEMQKLADEVESTVRQQHPDVADKLFALWKRDDLTDDEYDLMAVGSYKAAFETYWAELGKYSVNSDGTILKNNETWE